MDEGNREMWRLLRDRGLQESEIEKMQQENIDCVAVASISDHDLEKYIAKYGDRLVVRHFCERQLASEGQSSNEDSISRIAEKVENKSHRWKSLNKVKNLQVFGNKNAQKTQRRVEIGWLHQEGGKYKQIREKYGGGTRHLKTDANITMSEILPRAQELFFPDGHNSKGTLEQFDCTMMDFMETDVEPHSTVAQIYEVRKVKLLRLYLATKKKIKSPKQDTILLQIPAESDDASNAHSNVMGHDNLLPDLKTSNIQHIERNALEDSSEDDISMQYALISSLVNNDATTTAASASFDSTVMFGRIDDDDDDDDGNMLEDTLPLSSTPIENPKKSKIALHRGHVFRELNEIVKSGELEEHTVTLEVSMILPNGDLEIAEDTGGVLRDALSEYWDTFYEKCTEGNNLKVPVIRHDMTDTWESVAKVMVLGYKTVGYFPTLIARPFLQYCLTSVDPKDNHDELIPTFLEIVPEYEKKILEKSLNNFDDIRNEDDFLDLLDQHSVKSVVTANNWHTIIGEIAHKEIIQQPAYVVEKWSRVLSSGLTPILPATGLAELITSLEPTARKIIARLDFGTEELAVKDKCAADLLKRFIRQLSSESLKLFLRFSTGAHILVSQKISVRFYTPTSDFTRRPIAHTCTSTIEFPNTYSSLVELREEFTNILESKIWVMDIV